MPIRTISNLGGNYNAAATWVEGVFPTVLDDVISTPTSGNLTVNVVSAAKTFHLTGYTGTLTMNSSLTVSGGITLGSGMTVAGAGSIQNNITGTLRSNGVLWTGSLNFFGANQIVTLADDWTINGTVQRFGGGSGTVNGNNLYIKGSIINGAANDDGTTVYHMIGNGSISSVGGSLKHSIVINTTGTTTIGSLQYANGTITYLAGTVPISGTLNVFNLGVTLNTSGMTWNSIVTSQASNIVLNQPLFVNTITLGALNNDFSGLYGFSCNTFSVTTGNIRFQNGNTYRVAGGMSAISTLADPSAWSTISAGAPAIFILEYDALQNNAFVTATNIDSSQEQTIYTRKGTIAASTKNWKLLVPPTTTSSVS